MSVNRPAAGGDKFEGVTVGVAEVEAVAGAAVATVEFAFNGDATRQKMLAPGSHCFGGDGEREVLGAVAVVRRDQAAVHRGGVRGTAAPEQQQDLLA